MEFKRVKLLSGMLSAAALAGIAGAPVMAAEIPEEKFPLAKTLENDQAEDAEEAYSLIETGAFASASFHSPLSIRYFNLLEIGIPLALR